MPPVLKVLEGPEALTLAFNRPSKRNALNRELSTAIGRALRDLEDVPRPVVFRSLTPGMFMAGSDVAELKERTLEDSLSRLNGRLFQLVHDHPWPTIAAVEGEALGGGCELAVACDFRISTEDAVWGLPEVQLGIIPSGGALERLPGLVGRGAATDLVFTGRRIDGSRAHAIGLVGRLAPPGALDAGIAELLDDLARTAPGAVRLAKEAMRVDGDRGRLVDAAAQALCIGSDEAQQRMQSLLDHRNQPGPSRSPAPGP